MDNNNEFGWVTEGNNNNGNEVPSDGSIDLSKYATKSNPKFTTAVSMGRVGETGTNSTALGSDVEASGTYSHAEGLKTIASGGNGSHAEGLITIASGESSHAEGLRTNATGYFSHAEGEQVEASGYASHAQGSGTHATGSYTHAEGMYSVAEGSYSHAEGYNTKAKGSASHSEGANTTASGSNSHTEGYYTTASGYTSHAEGYYTIASSEYQHVQGQYNIEDTTNTYAHIVGNGTNDDTRSNAHTLDWDGNAWFAGEVYGTNIPYYREEVIVNMDYDDYDSIFKKTQPQNTQGYTSASPSRSIGLVTGDEYIVEWDDKRFLVIATYNSNYDATQIEFTMDYGDNGKIIVEIVDYLNFARLYYETQNYVGKITNNLFVKRPITNLLDSELLPDTVATKEYVDDSLPSIEKFKLVSSTTHNLDFDNLTYSNGNTKALCYPTNMPTSGDHYIKYTLTSSDGVYTGTKQEANGDPVKITLTEGKAYSQGTLTIGSMPSFSISFNRTIIFNDDGTAKQYSFDPNTSMVFCKFVDGDGYPRQWTITIEFYEIDNNCVAIKYNIPDNLENGTGSYSLQQVGNSATGSNSVALGNLNEGPGYLLGYGNKATGTAISIGKGNDSTGASYVLGESNTVTSGFAIGINNKAEGVTTVVGNGLTSTTPKSQNKGSMIIGAGGTLAQDTLFAISTGLRTANASTYHTVRYPFEAKEDGTTYLRGANVVLESENAPSADNHLVNKKYVDDAVANVQSGGGSSVAEWIKFDLYSHYNDVAYGSIASSLDFDNWSHGEELYHAIKDGGIIHILCSVMESGERTEYAQFIDIPIIPSIHIKTLEDNIIKCTAKTEGIYRKNLFTADLSITYNSSTDSTSYAMIDIELEDFSGKSITSGIDAMNVYVEPIRFKSIYDLTNNNE